jgi:hypothetical protein
MAELFAQKRQEGPPENFMKNFLQEFQRRNYAVGPKSHRTTSGITSHSKGAELCAALLVSCFQVLPEANASVMPGTEDAISAEIPQSVSELSPSTATQPAPIDNKLLDKGMELQTPSRLNGVHINPGDIKRAVAWKNWTGKSPDIIGDNSWANNWTEMSGSTGGGIGWILDKHAPKKNQPANPLAGTYILELAVNFFPRYDSDGTPFSAIPDRFTRAARGDYNEHWTALATELVARGLEDTWLRPAWEFNITDPQTEGWDDGGYRIGNADVSKMQEFAKYWRNIHQSMMAVSGAKFKFSWSVLAGIDSPENFQKITTYAWPGDEYVDHVSLDIYDCNNWVRYWRSNWQGANQNWLNQTTLVEMADRVWEELATGNRRNTGVSGTPVKMIPCLEDYADFADAHNKPIVISEWGIVETDRTLPSAPNCGDSAAGGNDNPEFILHMKEWIETHNVKANIYFEFFLNRQVDAYGETSPFVVDHAILPDYWNHAENSENPLNPNVNPHPKSAAAYLAAFTDRFPDLEEISINSGATRKVRAYQIENGVTGEINALTHSNWRTLGMDRWQSTSYGTDTNPAKILRLYTNGSQIAKCGFKGLQPGDEAGIVTWADTTPGSGYNFLARCGEDGLPDRYRLLRGNTQIWVSERTPMMNRILFKDWRFEPMVLSIRTLPGPNNTLRIEMHCDQDLAGQVNDVNPLRPEDFQRIGIHASTSGIVAEGLEIMETLFDDDFDDGHTQLAGYGWKPERLQFRTDSSLGDKKALAGAWADHDYTVKAKIGMSSPGNAGLQVLTDPQGNCYLVEIETTNTPKTRVQVTEIRIWKCSSEGNSILKSWTPSEVYFGAYMHDLKIITKDVNGKLVLAVTFNADEIMRIEDFSPETTSGLFGTWASSGTLAFIDDMTVASVTADEYTDPQAPLQVARSSIPRVDSEIPITETRDEWAFRIFHITQPDESFWSADSDGDSQSNFAEYLAGTDPQNSASSFRLSISGATEYITLSWPTIPTRVYQIYESTDLVTWREDPNVWFGTGEVIPVSLPVGEEARGFYQLSTNLDPTCFPEPPDNLP